MGDLYLELESVADMTPERAAAVGRAFDEHPHLRPLKVGGDPARIKVGSSMEELVRRTPLPVDWLTVRRNGRWPDFESGEIALFRGRGSCARTGDGPWLLVPHRVRASFLRTTLDEPGAVEQVVSLFRALADALDAFYGFATSMDEWDRHRHWTKRAPGGNYFRQVPDVFWLNCFGRAFVDRWPGLAGAGVESRPLASGGRVVRTTETPWTDDPMSVGQYDLPWKQSVLAVMGLEPFMTAADWADEGVFVPSARDHLDAAPGTSEMPWERIEAERDEKARARRHAAARKRRREAQESRGPVEPLPDDLVEWSTSFDLADWEQFVRHLSRRLKGDLTGPVGRALWKEIASAPLDEEESTDLATVHGTIRLGWFIDDVDVVDVSVVGAPAVRAVCEAWFAEA